MRIALYSRQPDGLKRLVEQLATDKRVSHLRTVAVDGTEVGDLSLHNVDVLILDDLIGEWITPIELEKISNSHPDALIMLIARQDSSALFVDAVGAGVRSILRWPATPAEIDHAVAQCFDRLSRHGARHEGRTFTIIAAKGGSGATFIALNLAYVWATRLGKRTLIIDLDLQYGDATFGLGESKHRSNVVQVAQDETLEANYLESACVPLRRNLFLLPSPVSLEEAARLEPSRLDNLLVIASRLFDVVIIDLPSHIDQITTSCMEHSNQVLQVVAPTVVDLRNQQRQLRYLHELGVPVAKVGTLINRMPVAERRRRNVDPFAAEIERHLSSRTLGRLPRDDDAAALSIGAGESVVTVAPDSPLSRALESTASSLVGATATESQTPSRWRQWLSLRRQ
jgi:pilus assembly protein CpaE